MKLSVLIATRNRSEQLRQTLSHLVRQRLDGITLQVVVVDNGSTDSTPAVLETAKEQLPLVPLREPAPGKNRALNRALDEASGELIVFTDDDVLPAEDWLLNLASAANRWRDCSVIGGSIEPLFPESTPSWLEAHPLSVPAFCRFQPDLPEGPIALLPFGGNFAARSVALDGVHFSERIGPAGSDYAMGSESDLLQRLKDRGGAIVYAPAATVRHVIRKEQVTNRWLFGRAFRFGRGERRREGVNPAAAYLFGAPRYLWRMAASACLRYMVSIPRGRRQRFEAGWRWHYLRGFIAECQFISRALD
jgi:glycosyltransferase involved in cell wall biosynthesis